jgi:plastocyanin
MSRTFQLLLGLGCVACVLGNPLCEAANITINIQGSGSHAQYIQGGATQQFNVQVTVGDTVTWVNPAGNPTHTATSELRDAAHQRIFDVTVPGGGSQAFTFTQQVYDAAVAAGGDQSPGDNSIQLGYYCTKHPKVMGGRIVLLPANQNASPKKHD